MNKQSLEGLFCASSVSIYVVSYIAVVKETKVVVDVKYKSDYGNALLNNYPYSSSSLAVIESSVSK